MSIAQNILEIKKKLPENVLLVAVSKTKPNEDLLEAYNVGQRVFGENKIQELTKKYNELPKDIQWHFIGHLQTNKVKFIVPFVDLIHAVDSLKLLETINKEAKKIGRKITCLLQMHIADEDTKFGIDFEDLRAILASDFYKELKTDENAGVEIAGLMGMATYTDDIVKISSEFAYLKSCFEKLKKEFFISDSHFNELSMGMSGDYELAINQGSTMIRVGSTIFGERNYKVI
jgi:pyridoxal phosphate enzyme (YggS family)